MRGNAVGEESCRPGLPGLGACGTNGHEHDGKGQKEKACKTDSDDGHQFSGGRCLSECPGDNDE
jgi:hypothetical protein